VWLGGKLAVEPFLGGKVRLMGPLEPPFRFDLSRLISAMRRLSGAVDGVTVRLPFVSVAVKPRDVERKVAREVVIRMADRRVLNSRECCDGCIKEALTSLEKIRRLIVDKQVELADHTHGALYLLLEAMAEAIRQFSTFEQRLVGHPRDRQQQYFAALETLRAHLHRVLLQVARVADIEIPKIVDYMRYEEAWKVEAYVQPGSIADS
jgi:hypothetical protein